jgi:citrate synthase
VSDRRGLRDVVAVESRLSAILDDDLTYRGYRIADLWTFATFAEVAYLLWFGDLPSRAELAAFQARLGAPSPPPATTARTPMRALAAGVLALADTAPADPVDQGMHLLTGLPQVLATYDRQRRGAAPVLPPAQGSLASQFLRALHGREPSAAQARALDRSFILIADHELNAATFAARVTASTGADLFASVLAAVATLSGPLHGGAAEATGELLTLGTPEQVAAIAQRRLEAGERIPGFGHAVYRRGDPRAPLFRQVAQDLAATSGDARYLTAADRLAAVVAERKGLAPNVDLYAAACWLSLEISPDLFPAVFALGRVAGWIAHIREQAADNRLIRPRAHYSGPEIRPFRPSADRLLT